LKRFDNLFCAVIAVPKATIDREETKWKRARAKKSEIGGKTRAAKQ
jgi:hypothetical protein